MTEPIVELTSEQRMRWGTCPVCKAEHGQPCDGLVGFPVGVNVSGERPTDGAHLGRLQRAPRSVRMVPVE